MPALQLQILSDMAIVLFRYLFVHRNWTKVDQFRLIQISSISEKQNQNQRPFTAKHAEDAKEGKQNQHQNQRPFTTEGTEDTEEEKGLPRMDADDRGLETEVGLGQTH
jgi:hypothetical protein